MPILNGHYSRGRVDEGIEVPPPDGLESDGAIFPGFLLQPGADPNKQKAAEGNLQIDTGALVTCVDLDAAEYAGLQLVDTRPISSATHTDQPTNVYAGIIEIPGSGLKFTSNQLYGLPLKELGLLALLGRDALKTCVFIYNGSNGTYTLTM